MINATHAEFRIHDPSTTSLTLSYKYESEYDWNHCSFSDQGSGVYECQVNLSYDNRSSRLWFYLERNGTRIPEQHWSFHVPNREDATAEELFLNLTRSTANVSSFRCSAIAGYPDCKLDHEWAQEAGSLAEAYTITGNRTYLDNVSSLYDQGIVGGTCDFSKDKHVCKVSANVTDPDQYSGAFKQGELAITFLELFRITGNRTYYQEAFQYLSNESDTCAPYQGNFSCDETGNGDPVDEYSSYIEAAALAYQQTGDLKFKNIVRNLSRNLYALNGGSTELSVPAFISAYQVTGNASYLNRSLMELRKLHGTCFSGGCDASDFIGASSAFSASLPYIDSYHEYNFYRQSLVYLLHEGFKDGFCEFSGGNYSCPRPYLQDGLALSFAEIYEQVGDTSDVRFRYPRSEVIHPLVDTPFNYTTYIEGYATNLTLEQEEQNASVSYLPINLSTYLQEELSYSTEKAHPIRYAYEGVDAKRHHYPEQGNLSVIVTKENPPLYDLFRNVGNDSLRDPQYYCDPFGSSPTKSDFTCGYDHFQASMLGAFSLRDTLFGAANTRSFRFLERFDSEDRVNTSNLFATCDPLFGDFACNQYVSSKPPSLQSYAQPGSYRQGELVSGLRQRLEYEEGFTRNRTTALFEEYLYTSPEDCSLFSGDYSCLNARAQGTMLGLAVDGYWGTGDDIFLEAIRQLVSTAKQEDLTDAMTFGANLWRADALVNERYGNLAANITEDYIDYCDDYSCTAEEKAKQVNLFLKALEATNNQLYAKYVDASLLPRTENFVCDAQAYYTQQRLGTNPSSSYLACDFPSQIGENSQIFSMLYSGYFDPTPLNFSVNISADSEEINFSDSFNTSCTLENRQDGAIFNTNVNLVTRFPVSSVAVDSALSYNLSNENRSIEVASFQPNTSYTINWTLNGSIGGDVPVSCSIGRDSDTLNITSGNIGEVALLNVTAFDDSLVSDTEKELLKVTLRKVPFLLENVTFNFSSEMMQVTDVAVYDNASDSAKNEIPHTFDRNGQQVTLTGDVNTQQTRELILNVTGGVGKDRMNVSMHARYDAFNTAESEEIVSINRSDFTTSLSVNPTFGSAGETITMTYELNNTASAFGVNYTFTDLTVSIDEDEIEDLNLSIINSTPNFQEVDEVEYVSFPYQEGLKLQWQGTYPFEDEEETYPIEVRAASSEGFLRIDKVNVTVDEAPSGDGGDGGGGGGGGGGSSSSSIFTSDTDDVPEEVTNETPEVNQTPGSNRTLNRTQESSPQCLQKQTYELSEIDSSDIANSAFAERLLFRVLTEVNRSTYATGKRLIDEYNIPVSNYSALYQDFFNEEYDATTYLSESRQFTSANRECLSVAVENQEESLLLSVSNFCDDFSPYYLAYATDETRLEEQGERRDGISYYYVSVADEERGRLTREWNRSAPECLREDAVKGVVLPDAAYLGSLSESTLNALVSHVESQYNVQVNQTLAQLAGGGNDEFSNGVSERELVSALLSRKRDEGFFSAVLPGNPQGGPLFWGVLGLAASAVLALSAGVGGFVYLRKRQEHFFYLLEGAQQDISDEQRNQKLREFYDEFSRLYRWRFIRWIMRDMDALYEEYMEILERLGYQ